LHQARAVSIFGIMVSPRIGVFAVDIAFNQKLHILSILMHTAQRGAWNRTPLRPHRSD
jgi:hypothetical protein